MKPIMIVPPNVLTADAIQQLRDNDLCVIVATDPAKVRFLDPLPAASQRSELEQAAILLSRKLINGHASGSVFHRGDFTRLYVDCLMKGTVLDPAGTPEERQREIFDYAKADEVRKIAREEARAERPAKKAQKAGSK